MNSPQWEFPTLKAGQTEQLGSAQVDSSLVEAMQLLRQIAFELVEQSDEIAKKMVLAYYQEIPAYAAIMDPSLREDVQSVSSEMVRCWLSVMSTGDPIPEALLRNLLEGVRRRVVQGIELPSVLRAFRLGIRVMWSEITGSPVWRNEPLQGLLAHIATWALDFADQISTSVAAAYFEESQRIDRERAHRRSALFDVILSGSKAESLESPLSLDLRHCVVVAKVTPNLTLLELERAGELLEQKAGALLWTVRHRSIVAVIAWPGDVSRSQLFSRLEKLVHDEHIEEIGIGGLAEGAPETRQSYTEAVAALRVGPLVVLNPRSVFDFQDFASVIAILEQPDRARRFVAGVLDPLGDLANKHWFLPTLEAFLSSQGGIKEVATIIGVHPNTVKYRLKELRGATDLVFAEGDRARTLVFALRVRRALATETSAHGRSNGLSHTATASAGLLGLRQRPLSGDPTQGRDLPSNENLNGPPAILGDLTLLEDSFFESMARAQARAVSGQFGYRGGAMPKSRSHR